MVEEGFVENYESVSNYNSIRSFIKIFRFCWYPILKHFPIVSLYHIFKWLKIIHAGMIWIICCLLLTLSTWFLIVSTFNITNTSCSLILTSSVIWNLSYNIFFMLSLFMLVSSFCKVEIKLRVNILKSCENILFYKRLQV